MRIITADSAEGKELIKWEQHKTSGIIGDWEPGNPYVFREYPKAMYRAMKRSNGQVAVLEPNPMAWDFDNPDRFQRECMRVEAQNAQCYKTVANEAAERLAFGQGWRPSQREAMDLYESEQQAIAEEAARVQFTVQRMSPKAQAELEAANDASDTHVLDMQGGSKKAGRPRRAKRVTGAGVETD